MPRHIKSILTMTSGLACLLLCGVWGLSYFRWLDAGYDFEDHSQWWAVINRGTIGVCCDGIATGHGFQWGVAPVDATDWTTEYSDNLHFFGFGIGWGPSSSPSDAWCPLWFPVLLTAIPPVVWWRRGRRTERGFEVRAAA
jgi:hypothetical protein